MATIANLVSYELKGVKESFANWISNISPVDTPFVSMTNKEKVQNKYFQWQEDRLSAVQSNNAYAEGSDAEATNLIATAVRKNVTQIMRKVVTVSDTASALASYGRGKELQYQMEKAAKELKRDIEWALLNNGTAQEGTGTAQDPVFGGGVDATLENSYPGTWPTTSPVQSGARRTAGFRGLVAPKGVASPEDPEAIVHASSTVAGTPSEDDIFKITKALYLAGAKATHIMFHPKHASFFSGLTEKVVGGAATRVMMFDGSVDTKVNKYVSCMVDPLGQRFCLIPNRFMPVDAIYFFAPSDWTQKVLREPGAQMLAKTGSFDKYMIEIELGLQHKNQYASGVLDLSAPVVPAFTAPAGANFSGDDASGYDFSAVAGSGAVVLTRSPAAAAPIVIKTNGTRTVASAATESSVTLTPGAAGAAEDIVLTVDGTDITISATVTAAPAPITNVTINPTAPAPVAGGSAVNVTATTTPAGKNFKVEAKDAKVTVTQPNASGLFTVTGVTAGTSGITITDTSPDADPTTPFTKDFPITVGPQPTVNGKIVPVGKKGGDVVAPADLFAVTNGATLAANLGTVTVTGGAAKGTWDDTTGLTIASGATGDIDLTFAVKGGAAKGSTNPKVTGVVAP